MYDVQSFPQNISKKGTIFWNRNVKFIQFWSRVKVTLICIQLRIVSPALHKLPDMYP